jgi:hypothetical protein
MTPTPPESTLGAKATGAQWLVPALLVVAITSFGYRTLTEVSRSTLVAAELEAVGSTGEQAPVAVDAASEPPESPALIQEIETITGAVDGHELIGRRVNLHVPVQSRSNDLAFWIGPRDNRVLVAMLPNVRKVEGTRRNMPEHRINPVHIGQQATVSGSIQKMPGADQIRSWALTPADRESLEDRQIYIRADSVTAVGHGSREAK